jgi:hypothetical protein
LTSLSRILVDGTWWLIMIGKRPSTQRSNLNRETMCHGGDMCFGNHLVATRTKRQSDH